MAISKKNWVEMSISFARHKLGETGFFLQKLNRKNKEFVKNRDEFSYNLSAFLNAAYSTIEGLAKFGGKSGFKEWYESSWKSRLSPEDKDLLEIMNKQRRREVHSKGAKKVTGQPTVSPVTVPGFEVFSPPAIYSEGTLKSMTELGLPLSTQAWVYTSKSFFRISGDLVEITQSCSRYFALLERLIVDFEKSR